MNNPLQPVCWESERQQVKQLWQHWSQKQLAIVGNVLFTPEEKGMSVLLGPQEEILHILKGTTVILCIPLFSFVYIP